MAQNSGSGNLFSSANQLRASNPNFVNSTSTINLEYQGGINVDQLTAAETQTLVSGGGIATALSTAAAVFIQDEAYAGIFASNTVTGELGTYNALSRTDASVVGTFSIPKKETFSFTFDALDKQTVKEIEQPDREHNYAQQNTAFAVLDITNPDRPKVIDHFAMSSKLESAKKKGRQRLNRSGNVKILDKQSVRNIDGNDGFDGLARSVEGRYERRFGKDTRLAVVELVKSYVEAVGDTYIGNLSPGTIYGTLRRDNLYARRSGSRLYASYGDDRLNGQEGDDILEGSYGNDRLKGRRGDDKLHGGFDDDFLSGGRGNDWLVGGEGQDTFAFRRGEFRSNERDIIADFQVGTDKLEFRGWRTWNIEGSSQIVSSPEGTVLKFNDGGEILFKGLSRRELQQAIAGRRGAQASFVPQGASSQSRPGTQTATVGFEVVTNLDRKQGAAQFDSVTAPIRKRPAATTVQKLDDSAIVKGLKIDNDQVQFQGNTQEYDLQFVRQAGQAKGASIIYKGSGDVIGVGAQSAITGDVFGAQVFGSSR